MFESVVLFTKKQYKNKNKKIANSSLLVLSFAIQYQSQLVGDMVRWYFSHNQEI